MTGPGWQIYLYGFQGFCLGAYGIGMLLFLALAFLTKNRASALFLAIGIIFSGIYWLFSSFAVSDFSLRCQPDSCSSVLATSVVLEILDYGYLLAAGTFFLGLGGASWLGSLLSSKRHSS